MIAKIKARGRVAYAHDIVMAAISFLLAFYLRVGDLIFYFEPSEFVPAALLFTAISAVVFRQSGLYRGVWRYASIRDLWAITKAVSIAVLIFSFVMFMWTRLEDLPRSIPIINWFVLMALLGGPRFFYRLVKDRRIDFSAGVGYESRVPVLLVGAGDGAELFLRGLHRSGDSQYRVVGIASEQDDRVGREIHGVHVLGTVRDIKSIFESLGSNDRPQRLVLTKDDMDGAVVRSLLEQADELGMALARLPRLTDFRSGVAEKLEVRPVDVADLLGRPQTPLDRDSMRRLIEGRRVLISGAGGSIGSELVRQVAAFAPAEITLLDSSEYALYAIDLEVSETVPEIARRAVIGDVRERDHLLAVFADTRPELVFHAAALKHVPLVEANPIEGIRTNFFGTINVADACVEHGVTTMVLVSTDKAVNPTSVMGVSKRLAEIYCQALDLDHDRAPATNFVTVRFGNVLGSTGSVVPLFQKQLERGGPLTVTHADMTRYFMTVREAVELILQASALGSPRDRAEQEGKIYVLDMGEPVRIIDLARQMIRLAGLRPDIDVQVEITGMRPGEKLFEEVLHGAEDLVETDCAGILLGAPRTIATQTVLKAFSTLNNAVTDNDVAGIITTIRDLVPEYTPSPDVSPTPQNKAVSGTI